MKSLDLALQWASAGWPVFPVRPNKRPWFADWNVEASTKPETIRKWWEHDTGNYLVGVLPAGANPPCFVLDVDVKAGHDGFASLAALAESADFSPDAYPSQDTPSGGRHLFLRGEAPTSAGTLGDGLDTRGGLSDGSSRGYVVAYAPPPSAPGDVPLAPAFNFGQREKVASDRHTPMVEPDLPDNIKRAKAYLSGIEPATEGSRNAALFKHVATIKDLGVSLSMAFALVEEYPAALGDPFLDDPKEIQLTVKSAYDNGQAPPGQHAVNPDTIAKLVAEERAKGNVPEAPRKPASSKRVILWPELEKAAPPNWIIKGLIPDNSLVGIFGPGGSYKSFIALDIALHVATGQMEWGGREIRQHGPVVIVQGEGRLDNRALAWQRNHLPIGDQMAMIAGMDLSDAADVEEVAIQIMDAKNNVWLTNPRLIIIDTLARASGGSDENSSKDMGKVVAHCDALRHTFGCTVILVHHTPKASHTWRGSTAVLFALDAALSVDGKDLKAKVEVTRQKDGEVGQEWKLTLEPTETGRVVDDSPETSLLITRVEELSAQDRKRSERIIKQRGQVETGMVLLRMEQIRSIVDGLPLGATLSRAALARQMAISTPGMDPSILSKWLRSEALKGTLNEFLVMADGSEFGRAIPQEKAPEVSPEGLPA